MRRVIVESPYRGDVAVNAAYLNECLRDSIRRGEAPFASHRMYTEALNDSIDTERELGIKLGFAWWEVADAVVFYVDFGWSNGMAEALWHAKEQSIHTELRTIRDGG